MRGWALVTGAARGLGLEIARALRAEGRGVVLCDVDAEAVAAAAAGMGEGACAEICDVADPEAVDALFARCEGAGRPIDVLVNNAGTSTVRPVLDLTPGEWNRVIATNLTGAFLCARLAARAMREREQGGRIVNITSISGQRGGTGRAAYGASKGGLEVLTKVMAVELAPLGITVNAVAPGPVLTELAAATHSPATVAAYEALIPMGRYGRPDEIVGAVTFLVSDAASYVTGHTINVDGGFGAAGLMFDIEGSAP